MNILYSYPSIRFTDKTYDVGGEERISWETISRVARRGHTCFITAPEIDLEGEYTNFNLYPVTGCGLTGNLSPMARRIRAYRFGIKSRRVVKNIINEHKIDVIHHLLPSYPGFYSSVSDLPAPFVWGPATTKYSRAIENTVRENAVTKLYDSIKRRKWYRSLRDASIILLEVLDAKRYIPEEFHGKVRVLYSGIDSTKFSAPYGPSAEGKNGKKTILYLTAVRKNKGADVLLKAVPKVLKSDKEVRFIFAGPVFDKDYFYGLAEELNINDAVEFTGSIDYKEIENYYAGADIYCLPSLQDNAPLSLLEAMASSRPVVASDVQGIPEVVRHGENGLLVEPNNPEKLAEALLKLLKDDKLRKKMAANNRKKIEKEFDWERHVDRLLEYYGEAADTER